MSNYTVVKDKKKPSPLTKLWKNFVSICGSKSHHLRKSQRTRKLVSTTNTSPRHHHHHHHHYYCCHHHVSHDQKLPESKAENSLVIGNKAAYDQPSSKDNVNSDDENEGLENDMEKSSNCNVALSHDQQQLLGVDAKAEEFIGRLKQVWRLEKQKSLDEYHEMLARSA